jgi:hypothetical protein
MARVLGLLYHAVVEVQPGKLAIDEAVRIIRPDARRRLTWRFRPTFRGDRRCPMAPNQHFPVG